MMRVWIFVGICILVVSCQGIKPLDKPHNLIPMDRMEVIIYDMTIINSARGYNPQLFVQTGVKPESHIFEKYKIDSLQYAASTVYYSADVDGYKKLIERVRTRVEKEFKVTDSLAKIEKRIQDSIRNERGKLLKYKKDSAIQAMKDAGRVVPKDSLKM